MCTHTHTQGLSLGKALVTLVTWLMGGYDFDLEPIDQVCHLFFLLYYF